MEHPRVVYAVKVHRRGLELLRERGFEVVVYRGGRTPPFEWLCRELRSADGLVVTPMHWVDSRLLGCSDRLRIIVVHGSGYENVDLRACEERGVCVVNEPDAIAESVAEHALALTLAVLRNVARGDRYVRSGAWREGPAPRPLIGTSLRGKTVGIVGAGRVGSATARLFKALGCRVVYWSRRRKPELEHGAGVEYVGLERLFEDSDVVVVALAYTPETHHMIGRELLSRMKRGSVLVNISRGAVVDTEALVEALRKGVLAGAGLDVFEEEPLPPTSPLIDMENVVLTPHIAGYTWEAMEATSVAVAQTLISYLTRGEPPPNPLTPGSCGVRGERV